MMCQFSDSLRFFPGKNACFTRDTAQLFKRDSFEPCTLYLQRAAGDPHTRTHALTCTHGRTLSTHLSRPSRRVSSGALEAKAEGGDPVAPVLDPSTMWLFTLDLEYALVRPLS